MLILTRRAHQSFLMMPHPKLDLATPVGEFFAQGPVDILVGQVNGARVKLMIEADPRLLILRKELYGFCGERKSIDDAIYF